MTQIKKISVIGLGLMGTPIATLLMKAGYQVTGFDIIKKQMYNLVPLGLRAVKSPKEAAKNADLVMLSLPTWNTVLEVVEGKDGLIEGAQRGQIVLDTSTSPPWESRALGERLAKKESSGWMFLFPDPLLRPGWEIWSSWWVARSPYSKESSLCSTELVKRQYMSGRWAMERH